jgi:hypothetical protein
MKHIIYIITFTVLSALQAFAQKEKKVTFVGGARSMMTSNVLNVADTAGVDTSTAKRNNGGYALIDLGINIKPNKNTEILGMFRIKNNFGGFWGSGVTFDIRQLSLKGVVANALRYQLGDINIKQTPFTLYNHHADAIENMPDIFAMQRNIVNYEKFYTRNTWRMQGVNIDFGFTFIKAIQELNVTAFTNRINATNFANVPERLMSGGVVEIVQSKKWKAAFNANYIYDVKGTVLDSNTFHNNVQSLDANFADSIKGLPIALHAEVGQSNYLYSADANAPNLQDYFAHVSATTTFPKQHLKAKLGYLNVGPNYRSIGAQSKDINYNSLPVFFDRYTNAQIIRPLSILDVISNENIYNRTITSKWMNENNLYNNAMPFGLATNNRLGGYAELEYNNNIKVKLSYHQLREITGQGTPSLRSFNIVNTNIKVPLNYYLKTNNKLELTAGAQMQSIKRNSSDNVENTDFTSNNIHGGLTYELFKNFDVMGAFLITNTTGVDFTTERNNYSEITYFNQQNYSVQQSLSAFGMRYNFSPKIYLSGFYQVAYYKDALYKNANFGNKQFNIIYNMLF